MIPLPPGLALKLVAGLCAALLLALLVHDRNRWKSTAALRHGQLVAERNAHAATIANYRAAAEQARLKDLESLARVKAQQARINERTADEFQDRIAAARSAYERLRRQAGADADPSRRRAAPVPGLSASAEGAPQGAGEDRLSGSDRLLATEQAIQLDELIKWVRRQHQVKPDND